MLWRCSFANINTAHTIVREERNVLSVKCWRGFPKIKKYWTHTGCYSLNGFHYWTYGRIVRLLRFDAWRCDWSVQVKWNGFNRVYSPMGTLNNMCNNNCQYWHNVQMIYYFCCTYIRIAGRIRAAEMGTLNGNAPNIAHGICLINYLKQNKNHYNTIPWLDVRMPMRTEKNSQDCFFAPLYPLSFF